MTTEPNAQDQYMLELLNRARLNPQAEADRLLNGNLNEGLPANTISTTPKQPLVFNLNLFQAASNHTRWMIDAGIFSHTGANESQPWDRATAAGYDGTAIGENLAFATVNFDLTVSTRTHHNILFTDTGSPGRGYRVNMLNNNFREVGISTLSDNFQGYNALLSTQLFGSSQNPNPFLTGVVYTDGVFNDNFYTVGEGMSGITIRAVSSTGQTFTTTSMSAGGYQIRLAPGTYTVTFLGDFNNDGQADTSRSSVVTLTTQNIKLDFARDTWSPIANVATDGNDTLTGTAANDTIDGLYGDDKISGLAGNDTIKGGAGNDTLVGGSGNDTMIGGTGNDIYYVDAIGDGVIETETSATEIDTVYSSITYSLGNNVERLILQGASAIDGTGNALNNHLYGNSGNNILNGLDGNDYLNGGAGVDRMIGGQGNDTYVVDKPQDIIEETTLSTDIDTVQSYADFYFLGNNIERLILLGNGSLNGTGNDLNNQIYGNSGNNWLVGGYGDDYINGGVGIDRMNGGVGNDTYIVDHIDDIVMERILYSSDRIDTNDIVYTSVSYDLSRKLYGVNESEGVEHLRLLGEVAINGTGNTLNNTIIGNSANNVLDGFSGRDVLRGGAGDDILKGNFEEDQLYGEAGNDRLEGGENNDYLEDNLGINQFLGGNGLDQVRLNFAAATTAIMIDYTNSASGTISGGSILQDIEYVHLNLGLGNDQINLSAANALVYAGNGNDRVIGGTGYYGMGAYGMYGQAGNDVLIGGTGTCLLDGGVGDDILQGGAGNDSGFVLIPTYNFSQWSATSGLYGGDGNDQLCGGGGDDDLQGGLGADRFLFDINTAFNSTIGVDTITDFLSGTDKIVLDKTTFTALTSAAGGSIAASEFTTINDVTNGATIAGSSASRIVFNRANGDLFYNADGLTPGLGTGGRFATLSGVSTLLATDLLLQA